jgi:pyruvate/2-oxoglutarate dehydrogenase complex dihydrolipoamide acyltransferase (E2) component
MGYTIKPFPPARQIIRDAGRLGSRRHVIHGLLEIDVTQARTLIRNYQSSAGQTLSFTAFVVGCLAAAIADNPSVQAYRTWRGRLLEFDDVDPVVLIETERDHVALPHIIRAANRKTVWDIHREIRAVQARPARSTQAGGITAWAPRVPGFIRDIFYWGFRQNPHWLKARAGTVVVTSVGLFGQGAGWGLTFLPLHTLGLTIGGIAEKPGVVQGQIAIREYLSLTLSFDHDIVDGAPAARFAQRLKELLEQGYGLCREMEADPSAAQAMISSANVSP